MRSLSFGLERLGLTALRYPAVIAAIIIAVTIAALFGISKLRVDDSLSELFRTDTPEFHDYELISKRFPSSEYDVLIVVTGKDLLARKSIEALRNLVTELQFVDGMAGEVSLFSAREAPEPGKVPGPVFPAKLPTGAAYDHLIDQVRNNEIIKGKLLSDDGTLTLVLLALDREVVASNGLNSVVQQIDETAKEQLKDTGLSMKLSGAPVMQLEIRNAVERDRNLYNALGFLFGAIIAYAFFRRLSLMAIAALPPVVAIIWSLGLFGWLGFKLNLFLNVMIPLIMVLGFSDSMQLTVAMRNRLLEGDRRIKAARYAVLVVGPACVLATATAAASFIALFFSDSALIRTFGFAGALSTMIAFVVGITLVPLLTRALIGRNTKPFVANLKSHDRAMNALKRFCGWVAEIGVRHPKTVVGLGLLLVIAFGAVYTTLPPRYRLADQVPDREQAVAASAQLDEKLTGANPLHVMVDWPQGKTLYDPDVLKLIGDIHILVETQSGVGNVWSVETLRRWLTKTGEDTPERLKD
ncbi:MAG: MMPL family transporter, partial [Methyloceanibacter sp.]